MWPKRTRHWENKCLWICGIIVHVRTFAAATRRQKARRGTFNGWWQGLEQIHVCVHELAIRVNGVEFNKLRKVVGESGRDQPDMVEDQKIENGRMPPKEAVDPCLCYEMRGMCVSG